MHIHDLTPNDLYKNPVWYFVSDDDVTIKPLLRHDKLDEYHIIVRTTYIDANNNKFIGFIDYCYVNQINYIFPVMFYGNTSDDLVYFWNGMFEPSNDNIEKISKYCSFPISYESEQHHGLISLKGTLEGIYYFLDKSKKIMCKKA